MKKLLEIRNLSFAYPNNKYILNNINFEINSGEFLAIIGANGAGINVNNINFIMALITAITVSMSARTVGSLMISSFIVLPVASSMQISRSYKNTILIAIIFAILSTSLGLTLSFYYGLKPGGTIVILSVIFFLMAIFIKKIIYKK